MAGRDRRVDIVVDLPALVAARCQTANLSAHAWLIRPRSSNPSVFVMGYCPVGLTDLVGTQEGRNGALSWGNRRDETERSCDYASR